MRMVPFLSCLHFLKLSNMLLLRYIHFILCYRKPRPVFFFFLFPFFIKRLFFCQQSVWQQSIWYRLNKKRRRGQLEKQNLKTLGDRVVIFQIQILKLPVLCLNKEKKSMSNSLNDNKINSNRNFTSSLRDSSLGRILFSDSSSSSS